MVTAKHTEEATHKKPTWSHKAWDKTLMTWYSLPRHLKKTATNQKHNRQDPLTKWGRAQGYSKMLFRQEST